MYTNKDSEYVTSGFEFETLGLLGSNCGITDIDLLARLDRLCDDLGLDTMEVGAALGVKRIPAGVRALVDRGRRQAMLDDPALLKGLNVIDGKVVYAAVANDLGYALTEPHEALALG